MVFIGLPVTGTSAFPHYLMARLLSRGCVVVEFYLPALGCLLLILVSVYTQVEPRLGGPRTVYITKQRFNRGLCEQLILKIKLKDTIPRNMDQNLLI